MQTRFSLTLCLALAGFTGFAAAPACAAIAGAPEADDVKTIETCLADAAKAKTDPDACIGRVTGGCLAKASTLAAMQACSNREFLVWDAALNRDFARLVALLPNDNAKQSLRAVERDFYVAKMRKCAFVRIAHGGGPKSFVLTTQCNLAETGRQDLWMLEQIHAFKPQ